MTSLAVPVRESDVSLVMSTATDGVDATTSPAVTVRESDVSLVMSAATDWVDALISPAVPVRDYPLLVWGQLAEI